MDRLRQQAMELWARWQALSLGRKLVWSIGLACSLTLAVLLWWAAQPEYRVLYTGLSADEAGQITAKLQGKGIPFKLAAGGSTILVQADQAALIHLDMNREGVAGAAKFGKGFELIDQPSFGNSPTYDRMNIIRAQQGELAKTIMQLEPVTFARVHITRPESSPFVRDQKPATASVMVKLRPGAVLNRQTAMGIASLVSGSVEGLAKENVRILDGSGRPLSVERDPDTGMVGSFMDARKEVEADLAREAERMLERALGPGKAVVKVTADIDTKIMKKREEKFTGDPKIKTEKNILTKNITTGTGKGGPAGTPNNTTGKGPSTTSTSGGTQTSENTHVEYMYPSTVIEWTNKHGTIERLTVAAIIDSTALANSDPPISLDSLKEVIKKAVGFKSDRDEIQVAAVKMPSQNPETIEEDTASATRLEKILTIVRYVSIGAIALCVLPILWMVFRRRQSAAPAAAPADQASLQRLSEELERNPDALAKILSKWMEQSEMPIKKA
ncbi:MAG TPA: flagellar basal-body MS-ring/collar protein FliF, partial [Gemmataceae bacterium]|nr:flagellar basal-body MS-ring/collar protein FliF [Gemmataceae bacterium]